MEKPAYQYVRDMGGQTSTQVVQRTSDGAFIPNDANNPDWREYQDWLSKEGNVPAPPASIHSEK